jgi:hypothetical protein
MGCVIDRGEVDRRVQLLERHGKDDGVHLIANDAVDAGLECLTPPDGEVIAALKIGPKKGMPWM